ncbi:hypothetical protein ACR6C2_33400 [Streptomyces sp. INA 01156]
MRETKKTKKVKGVKGTKNRPRPKLPDPDPSEAFCVYQAGGA